MREREWQKNWAGHMPDGWDKPYYYLEPEGRVHTVTIRIVRNVETGDWYLTTQTLNTMPSIRSKPIDPALFIGPFATLEAAKLGAALL
jgi:hypothetical protein